MAGSKIISFSLWGTDPKYCLGAVENLKLQQEVYPGWICRFYVDSSIPEDTLQALKNGGAEIVVKDLSDGYEGAFWRFEAGFDETCERFIVRDCDSRLNIREADAVKEWEESGLPFHCMRDHKGHDIPVLAGMWGATGFFIPNFEEIYRNFLNYVKQNPIPIAKRATTGRIPFYTDQIFLNQIIWPKVSTTAMVHDDRKRFSGNEKPFLVNLPEGLFIGQQYGADNKPLAVPV